ncbi:MAG: sigma-70 family RNA polymerase sigma factor [Pontiellaceae bacterium]|nr:sigma-70 family RNA polymerase sigma factor [Pontiellaceae bacterium]
MKTNDTQLMQRMIDANDHAAFEELVNRYVHIAYSAAMICLGNEDLAKDACQATFLALAKKANKLPPDLNLGGWIFSTARNLSRNIQRSEIRRIRREQTYVDQMNTSKPSDWSALAPDIHETLDQLKKPDRDAIILRYFQDKSLAEVGDALGISTDAARMKINRALERMNQQLVRKGITSTAAALAAALPAHAALAAPADLASTISTTVLASTGAALTTSTLTGSILAIMKTKTIIITAAVAATVLVGGGIYLSNQSKQEINNSDKTASSEEATSTLETTALTTIVETIPEPIPTDPTSYYGSSEPYYPAVVPVDISPESREQAEQMLSLLEMALPLLERMGNNRINQAFDTGDLAKKLELRLNMDEEQAAIFSDILASYEQSEAQRYRENLAELMDTFTTMLDDDRDSIVDLIALRDMQRNGESLSVDQEDYFRSIAADLGENFNLDDPSQLMKWQTVPWNENEDVMYELNAELWPDQQAELATYLQEQQLRETEEAVYRRTNRIANDLGLNEADRVALYDYLYTNPEATQDDIAEKLSPELRDLLD